MKKFFIVAGVIFVCLIVLGVIFISIAAYTGSKLDAQSKAYVDRIVPLIVTSWDAKALLDNASPEFLKAAPPDKIDPMFKMFAEKLGAYKEYRGSTGDSLVSISPEGKILTAAYVTQIVFDKADAEVKIRIIKRGETWQILEFFVNSQAFMP